jgi:hypothetical protein
MSQEERNALYGVNEGVERANAPNAAAIDNNGVHYEAASEVGVQVVVATATSNAYIDDEFDDRNESPVQERNEASVQMRKRLQTGDGGRTPRAAANGGSVAAGDNMYLEPSSEQAGLYDGKKQPEGTGAPGDELYLEPSAQQPDIYDGSLGANGTQGSNSYHDVAPGDNLYLEPSAQQPDIYDGGDGGGSHVGDDLYLEPSTQQPNVYNGGEGPGGDMYGATLAASTMVVHDSATVVDYHNLSTGC